MSTHGLEVFDRTLETTHIWLNEICSELGPDKHLAWKVLSTVLQRLRDRLPIPLAAHLGAQLPLLRPRHLLRPVEPGRLPNARKSRDGFIAEVAEELGSNRPINADHAIRCVFGILSRHISDGQVRKIRDALPHGMRELWSEERRAGEARQLGRRPASAEKRRSAEEELAAEPLILTRPSRSDFPEQASR